MHTVSMAKLQETMLNNMGVTYPPLRVGDCITRGHLWHPPLASSQCGGLALFMRKSCVGTPSVVFAIHWKSQRDGFECNKKMIKLGYSSVSQL